MYCSSCGGAVLQGLTYCNHCGARLNAQKREDVANSAVSPDSVVGAIVAVFIAGMGTIIGLMAVMKNVLAFNMGLIIFFSLLSFLLMTVIEGVFISRLLGKKRSREDSEPTLLSDNARRELSGVQAKALAEPIPSVTDHTTRSFEPIYTKRSSE